MCYLSNAIIIADDDVDDSLFLMEALHGLKRELIIINVPNVQMLIDVLDSISPGLIFLDINMPNKNGFEALKQIRSTKRLDQPKVIMCSTSSSINDIRISAELGADMYVTKPTNIKHYSKMIEDIFERDWSAKTIKTIPEKFLYSHVQ